MRLFNFLKKTDNIKEQNKQTCSFLVFIFQENSAVQTVFRFSPLHIESISFGFNC